MMQQLLPVLPPKYPPLALSLSILQTAVMFCKAVTLTLPMLSILTCPFPPLFAEAGLPARAPSCLHPLQLVKENAVGRCGFTLELLQFQQIVLHFLSEEGEKKGKKKKAKNAPAQYLCQGWLGGLLLCISMCFVQKQVESRVRKERSIPPSPTESRFG